MKNYFPLALCTIAFVILCMYACRPNPLNQMELTPYDQDGVLKKERFESFYSLEKPDGVGLYIETSGSMNGLFRPNQSTKFQYDLSAVLTSTELKNVITGVNIFNNSGDGVQKFGSVEFREKMNKGDFISQRSTYIPRMIETMLSDVDSCACDVAVLISDMKFSPVESNGTVTKVAIDQYKLEIKKLFEERFKDNDMSVSLICCESNFLDKKGSELCAEFPYYFVVVGKSSRVAWVRNQMMEVLSEQNNLMGCIDFNVNYGCPNYTVLINETIGATQNYNEPKSYLSGLHSSSIVDFNDSYQPVRVVVGVNYRHLPLTLTKSLRPNDFKVSSFWGGNLNAKIVAIDNKNHQTCSQHEYVSPNVYLTIELAGLNMYEDDVVEIVLDSESQNIDWLNKYYGATREGELDKTFLLEGFIEGLNLAKPIYNVQNSSMSVFVSKDSNN